MRLACPYVVGGASAEVTRDAVRDQVPSLPDEIKNVSLITMQTMIDIQGTRTYKEDHRGDQPQETTRVEDEEKEEEVAMKQKEKKEEKCH